MRFVATLSGRPYCRPVPEPEAEPAKLLSPIDALNARTDLDFVDYLIAVGEIMFKEN